MLTKYSSSYLQTIPHYTFSYKNIITSYIINLYRRTFPKEDNIEALFESRRKATLKIKNELKLIPDEDIEKYNSFIPEWKRNSIVLINTSLPTNKFKLTKYLKRLMPSLERFPKLQKLYHKSDLYYITKDLKKSLSNIRYNLTFTSNPLITVPKDLLEKVQFKSPLSKCVEIMKQCDKDFTIEKFEKEIQYVFKQFLTLSKGNDLSKIKKIASESALALVKNDIKERKDKSFDYIYKEPLYVDTPTLTSCEMIDNDNVIMRLKISTQECIGKKYKNKEIKEKGVIENNQYVIDVIKNPVPFIEDFGHCYLIVNYQKVESYRQLI